MLHTPNRDLKEITNRQINKSKVSTGLSKHESRCSVGDIVSVFENLSPIKLRVKDSIKCCTVDSEVILSQSGKMDMNQKEESIDQNSQPSCRSHADEHAKDSQWSRSRNKHKRDHDLSDSLANSIEN